MATPEENNLKLFRLYTKKLSSDDVGVYLSHSEKLRVWLSDVKAYYAGARKEILKLILVAQLTLRRALGANLNLETPFNVSGHENHPMVTAYVGLVRAIQPFVRVFVEPDLQVQATQLLQTIATPISTTFSVANRDIQMVSSLQDAGVVSIQAGSNAETPGSLSSTLAPGRFSLLKGSRVNQDSIASTQSQRASANPAAQSLSENKKTSNTGTKKKIPIDLSSIYQRDFAALRTRQALVQSSQAALSTEAARVVVVGSANNITSNNIQGSSSLTIESSSAPIIKSADIDSRDGISSMELAKELARNTSAGSATTMSATARNSSHMRDRSLPPIVIIEDVTKTPDSPEINLLRTRGFAAQEGQTLHTAPSQSFVEEVQHSAHVDAEEKDGKNVGRRQGSSILPTPKKDETSTDVWVSGNKERVLIQNQALDYQTDVEIAKPHQSGPLSAATEAKNAEELTKADPNMLSAFSSVPIASSDLPCLETPPLSSNPSASAVMQPSKTKSKKRTRSRSPLDAQTRQRTRTADSVAVDMDDDTSSTGQPLTSNLPTSNQLINSQLLDTLELVDSQAHRTFDMASESERAGTGKRLGTQGIDLLGNAPPAVDEQSLRLSVSNSVTENHCSPKLVEIDPIFPTIAEHIDSSAVVEASTGTVDGGPVQQIDNSGVIQEQGPSTQELALPTVATSAVGDDSLVSAIDSSLLDETDKRSTCDEGSNNESTKVILQKSGSLKAVAVGQSQQTDSVVEGDGTKDTPGIDFTKTVSQSKEPQEHSLAPSIVEKSSLLSSETLHQEQPIGETNPEIQKHDSNTSSALLLTVEGQTSEVTDSSSKTLSDQQVSKERILHVESNQERPQAGTGTADHRFHEELHLQERHLDNTESMAAQISVVATEARKEPICEDSVDPQTSLQDISDLSTPMANESSPIAIERRNSNNRDGQRHDLALSANTISDVKGQIPDADHTSTQLGTPTGIFSGQYHVLGHHRGLKAGNKIKFCFENVPQDIRNRVLKWLNRRKHKMDCSDSWCLSLGCYASQELLQQKSEKHEKAAFQQLISTLKPVWPQNNGLSMQVHHEGKWSYLPLAPPFFVFVSSEGLVDVTDFLMKGENVIRLELRLDMSDYHFALMLHHPTKGQMKDLASDRAVEEKWDAFKRKAYEPLKLTPFPRIRLSSDP